MYGFRRLINVQQNTLLAVLLVLLLSSNRSRCCNAQATATMTLEYFNYSTSYRQNVCERQVQLDNSNETLQLRDALAGLQLSTFIYLDNRYVKFDNTTKALNAKTKNDGDPGLIAVLLDELAARAGFTWRTSFGVIESMVLPKDSAYTYSDLLLWSVSSYDISAAYWQKTLQRMQQGSSFPEGWYDASSIMITIEKDYEDGANNLESFWGFLAPFSTGVWIMIFVTIVVSALVYWFLDWYDATTDKMSLDHEPAQNLFLAAMTFTGNFEFQPNSNPARIFAVSLALFSLILMSSYTGTKKIKTRALSNVLGLAI
jgi:Ligand-gated ion channel